MGVKLNTLVKGTPLQMKDLGGRTIAIDAFNWIFQFLTTIRLADGSYLTDKQGRITTHLNGLFYRSLSLLTNKITPVYVFDGKAPKFKKKTLEERHRIKSEAMELSKTAKTIEEKTMYLRRTAEIDSYIIDSSIELLNLMGIRTIKAPAEGEAQAARLNANGLVYAVASQDYDTILFGANRIVRNLNITNRKKVTGKGISTTVSPELIEAKKFFSETGLDREKAILIAMMVGTDYNKGVMGIGPKKALKIVKEETREQILSKYDFRTENDVNEVYNYFISPNVVDYKELSNQLNLDKEKVLRFLCDEHGFDRERMSQSLEKIDTKSSSLLQYG